ncbi:hypothetical protein BDV97DRAFT_161093 [Delphinella strobiligena]|nr:hypothetical protein BDV97DRAFT_161093 [Delphinella strobiligena]
MEGRYEARRVSQAHGHVIFSDYSGTITGKGEGIFIRLEKFRTLSLLGIRVYHSSSRHIVQSCALVSSCLSCTGSRKGGMENGWMCTRLLVSVLQLHTCIVQRRGTMARIGCTMPALTSTYSSIGRMHNRQRRLVVTVRIQAQAWSLGEILGFSPEKRLNLVFDYGSNLV